MRLFNCRLTIRSLNWQTKKNKPTQSIIERYVQLRGCKYIDEIIPYVSESDLIDVLSSFKIDLRIIGEEYIDKVFTGKNYCVNNGFEIYYPRTMVLKTRS